MHKKAKRQIWGKYFTNPNLPKFNFTNFQTDSYNEFLAGGIRQALVEINPIKDFTGKIFQLEFFDHVLGTAKVDPRVCLEKGITYEAPLRVTARLTNLQTKTEQEQEVFLGDIPLMTASGTFIINGVERVVVSQLVRSPGVFFTREIDPNSGRSLYNAEIRPLRGSWLEVNVSRHDHLSVKVDRYRKISATTLLRAMGYTNEQIKGLFTGVDTDTDHQYIETTLLRDTSSTPEEAVLEFYEKIRPGEPAVLENAKNLLHQMFFDPRRYDLGQVGRYKLNKKLGTNVPVDSSHTVINREDVVGVIKYIIGLQNGNGRTDDIDHLANRRVRRVGELVCQTAFRNGLIRLERSIKEKMSLAKADELHAPSTFVNARPIIASISEFFRRNRLSSILDQINPLSEVDNLRRLSVMGTGGITRERASFSMRDINASQYSRMCPVRSPEGQNIGLVTYLALFARVNEYGFLEAPYFKVENGKVSDELVYLTADDESEYYITHAEVNRKDGKITDKWVAARFRGQFIEVDVNKIQLIDATPQQVVGVSAALIPFIQHDDGTRALMGTNMQCQAIPLVRPEAPVIGTGMEEIIAGSMNWITRAAYPGVVDSVDATHVSVKLSDKDADRAKELLKGNQDGFTSFKDSILTYQVRKFHRTAQSTAYNQHPAVKVGDKVAVGDLLIDGPSSDNGELAIGQNLTIAYGSFEGLGYEDAIVISGRLLKKDILSSVHVDEHICELMETKLGPEELTNDIPNVAEDQLKNLDKDGIVVIGSQVHPNDILVGKIAPRGETELTAEERLLRAIFGEKAREVRDTSLRMPHGEQGTVIDVQILERSQGDEVDSGVIKVIKVKVAELRKITAGDKIAGRHGNKGVISKVIPESDMPYLPDGTPIDILISPLGVLSRMNLGQLLEAQLGWAASTLGMTIGVPVFEKIHEKDMEDLLKKAGLPVSGKIQLYDGRTGEPFFEKTAVGTSYILKLNHMVEDKAHARSTGPYSIVTQQPLGGKAQMGGQRLGEMEVWALEGHKAAHVLQEMLTIKSDDVVGRSKAFESIVKGEPIPESTIPESFKVLVKELNSLCLSITPTGEVSTVPGAVAPIVPAAPPDDDDEDDADEKSNPQASTNVINDDPETI